MYTRLNILVPTETYKRLKKIAPERGVGKFITEAAEKEIRRLEIEEALKELEALPPAFTFLKGKNAAVRYVRKLRATDEKRLKRIWSKRGSL